MSFEVGEHYDSKILGYESRRLEDEGAVELGVTLRFLEEYLPDAGMAIDVGVGVGHYAEFIARRGLEVHLVDVSKKLLSVAAERLEAAGLGSQIVGVHHASASDLSPIPDGAADVVLMLGPLYHLPELQERQACAAEARRVLTERGRLFGAGINRLAYLRDLYLAAPQQAVALREFHSEYLADGGWEADPNSPLYQAHLTTIEELRSLFESGFEELAMAGVESFIPRLAQRKFPELDAETQRAWIDLAFETSTWLEGLGAADHFLYVGERC